MASKHMTDLTKVSSISDTDLLLVETSNGTRAIEKSDSDTNLQDQIDSIVSSVNYMRPIVNEVRMYRYKKMSLGTLRFTVHDVNNSIAVFTTNQLNEMFGVDNCSNRNTFCFFTNSDGSLQDVHIDGATYLNRTWYATANKNFKNGKILIGYLVIYLTDAG